MISREERCWVVAAALIMLAVTSLPYLLGYQLQPAGWRFSGFVFGVEDGNSYLAKMLRGAAGDWLFRSPYSAYPQGGILAFLPYLLLGKFSAPPGQHEQLVALFQLLRWAGGLAMILATYRWMAVFFDRVNIRRFGTLLALFGGGFGWLALVGLRALWGGRIPLEYYSPETFGFLSLLGLPHLALARALLLWGLMLSLRLLENPSRREAFLFGGVWLLMGLVQPLSVATGWALVGAQVLALLLFPHLRPPDWQLGRVLSMLAVSAVLSVPLLVYTLLASLADPYVQGWTAQNIILSSPVVDYLLAFGGVLPFVWLALCRLRGRLQPRHLLLVLWLALFPILAYAPHTIQRRLPEGIWCALVALALLSLQDLRPAWHRPGNIWLGLGFLPATFLFAGSLFALFQPQPPLYQPAALVQAYEYLADAAPANAVVLAAFDPSNPLPAYAPLRTITGHGPESIHADALTPKISRFFSASASSEERAGLVRQFDILYVLTTGQEALPIGWKPSDSAVLVYQNGSVRVFRTEVSP